MKSNRGLLLVLATISILAISNLLNFTVSTSRFNQSYPSVICPPNTSGLTTAISLASSKTQIRKTGTSSMSTREAGISRYAIASQSAVIDAGAITPVVWQVRKGVWAGASACQAPITSRWLSLIHI